MKSANFSHAVPKLPQVKSITALRRGLDTLGFIRQGNGLALGELHAMTTIPKPSLLRILKTLEESGWIRRRMGDGLYVAQDQPDTQPETGGSAGMTLENAAACVLRALKTTMLCPSDLAIRSGTRMRVVQSNRSLFGNHWTRTVIGAQPDMLGSAMGRAYLAFCPDDERQDLLSQLVQPNTPIARKREWFDSLLKDICVQGYATRDPLYAGPDADHDIHLSAMAVPIYCDIGIAGCLSCVWRVNTVEQGRINSTCLSLLVNAANQISELLAGCDLEPPQIAMPTKAV